MTNQILPQRITIRKSYLLPNLLISYENFLRLHNLDIQEMDDIKIYNEEIAVKLALSATGDDKPLIFVAPNEFVSAETWLIGRLAAIRKERLRREGTTHG